MSYRVVNLGELAHIVGQQASSGSPRGQDPLPEGHGYRLAIEIPSAR